MLATSVTSECLDGVILGLICPLDTQQSKMKCTEHTGQWLILSYGETADMDLSALPSPPTTGSHAQCVLLRGGLASPFPKDKFHMIFIKRIFIKCVILLSLNMNQALHSSYKD